MWISLIVLWKLGSLHPKMQEAIPVTLRGKHGYAWSSAGHRGIRPSVSSGLAILTAVTLWAALGCATSTESQDPRVRTVASEQSWVQLRVRVEPRDQLSQAVIVEFQLADRDHQPELYALAEVLAREPGVLLTSSGLSLHLPPLDKSHFVSRDGDIVIQFHQSYDPSLKYIQEGLWESVIPIDGGESLNTSEPQRIVVNPSASPRALASFAGVSFVW